MMDARFVVSNQTRGTQLGDRITLADDPIAKLVGLLDRPALFAGDGLWLPGANSIHMIGMRFPIDIIFLGAEHDGVAPVTDLRENLSPWTGVVWWSRGAKAALELPAGVIAASDTRPGDLIARVLVV